MARKPPRNPNEEQPLAPEVDAITRDIVGETHPKVGPPDERGTMIYVVQPGDTLAGIARNFYGDERHSRRILDANRDRIDGDDALEPGVQLRIPLEAAGGGAG